MSFAFVFPGQGSQSVGMLAGLAAADPLVESTFARPPRYSVMTCGSWWARVPKVTE
jgi:malonyl CoA-acyl carrier protein transacylase